MKTNIKLAFIAITVIISSFSATAQKIAHINLDSLISVMPETKTAQQALMDYSKQLEQQITDMQTKLQTEFKEYQEKSIGMPQLIKTEKEKGLNEQNQRIQDFQKQAQADYQKKNTELSKPIYGKAKKAVDEVAKQNGYKYVLNTSTGTVMYTEPADDLFDLVVKKLGIVLKR